MALEKITALVLDVIKYNDRHNVVTLFSRERGRISFLSAAGNGKATRVRNARLMTLSLISSEVNFHENKSLQTLGAILPARVWKDLYFNPIKASLAIFLAEFLNRYLRDSPPDAPLFDFIVDSLIDLDSRRSRPVANFHISFLISMLQYAGIQPDMSDYERGDWFDMRAGITSAYPPPHNNFLAPDETLAMKSLLRMNHHNDRLFRLSGAQRRLILCKLLEYYAVHFPGVSNLNSPSVLTELFS